MWATCMQDLVEKDFILLEILRVKVFSDMADAKSSHQPFSSNFFIKKSQTLTLNIYKRFKHKSFKLTE